MEIRNNKATNAGGGIAVKGHLTIGSSQTKTVTVHKNWVAPEGTSALGPVTVKLYIDGAQDGTAREVEQADLNASNDWTCQFTDLPVKAKVNVEEVGLGTDGWVTYYEEATEGEQAITNPESDRPGTEQTTYAENEKVAVGNALAGKLKISMSVAGSAGEADKEFPCKVSIVNPSDQLGTHSLSVQDSSSSSGEPYLGRDAVHHDDLMDFSYAGSKTGVLQNGEGTINLKNGESVTISGLPHGAHYEVSQDAATSSGYAIVPTRGDGTTGAAAQQGTIVGGQEASLSYQNTRDATMGSLKVSNIVTGTGADTQKQFRYLVKFYESGGAEMTGNTFSYTGSSNGTIGSGGQFALKSGESIEITGIPAETRWTVSEIAEDARGYTVTAKRGTLTGDEAQSGTIEAAQVTELAYENERTLVTGSLSVAKVLQSGDADREFKINVTLGDASGSGPDVNTYSYAGSSTGSISNGGVLLLKGGESVTIADLPAGTTYRIAETDADGYTVTYAGESGTIVQDVTAQATVTNKLTQALSGDDNGDSASQGSPNGDPPDNASQDTPAGDSKGNPSSNSHPASPSTGDMTFAFVETIGGCALAIALLAATFITRNWRKRIEHR